MPVVWGTCDLKSVESCETGYWGRERKRCCWFGETSLNLWLRAVGRQWYLLLNQGSKMHHPTCLWPARKPFQVFPLPSRTSLYPFSWLTKFSPSWPGHLGPSHTKEHSLLPCLPMLSSAHQSPLGLTTPSLTPITITWPSGLNLGSWGGDFYLSLSDSSRPPWCAGTYPGSSLTWPSSSPVVTAHLPWWTASSRRARNHVCGMCYVRA